MPSEGVRIENCQLRQFEPLEKDTHHILNPSLKTPLNRRTHRRLAKEVSCTTFMIKGEMEKNHDSGLVHGIHGGYA